MSLSINMFFILLCLLCSPTTFALEKNSSNNISSSPQQNHTINSSLPQKNLTISPNNSQSMRFKQVPKPPTKNNHLIKRPLKPNFTNSTNQTKNITHSRKNITVNKNVSKPISNKTLKPVPKSQEKHFKSNSTSLNKNITITHLNKTNSSSRLLNSSSGNKSSKTRKLSSINMTIHESNIHQSSADEKAIENEKLFAREEKAKLFLQHKNITSLSRIEDEIKKISSSSEIAELTNVFELEKFNFKAFLEVFAVIVMISMVILIFNYLSEYSNKKKYFENHADKFNFFDESEKTEEPSSKVQP